MMAKRKGSRGWVQVGKGGEIRISVIVLTKIILKIKVSESSLKVHAVKYVQFYKLFC